MNKKKSSFMDKCIEVSVTIFCMCFTALIVIMFVMTLAMFTYEHSRNMARLVSWDKAEGKIIELRESHKFHKARRKRMSYTTVTQIADYVFCANDNFFTGSDEYEGKGSKVVVYYDPKDPSKNTLANNIKGCMIWGPVVYILDVLFFIALLGAIVEFVDWLAKGERKMLKFSRLLRKDAFLECVEKGDDLYKRFVQCVLIPEGKDVELVTIVLEKFVASCLYCDHNKDAFIEAYAQTLEELQRIFTVITASEVMKLFSELSVSHFLLAWNNFNHKNKKHLSFVVANINSRNSFAGIVSRLVSIKSATNKA